ncbi:thiamine phosphate synthase [Chthonobacter rhizosphaerae]|uniref:thiamine phosphate synthase n=1 Tax=Chthonobacter rhizosphaerae TaxID=2735553 RepID=UPI0015EECCC9|nr:thiamine phosphate synthase [Chthonobacter rhizosphaerae]
MDRPPRLWFDLALYVVTDHRLPFEALVDTTLAAVAGGVTLVQLRNPDLGGRALLDQAVALMDRLTPLGVPLVVNDRVDVAAAAGAAGVHVGQSDLPAEAARRILGPDAIVGLSITEAGQLSGVDAAAVDYLGVGPVFATGTKPDAAAALGIDGLAAIVRASPLRTVAIGGIDGRNAEAVARTGVDGLSVVSAISAAPDPAAAARALRAALERARTRGA